MGNNLTRGSLGSHYKESFEFTVTGGYRSVMCVPVVELGSTKVQTRTFIINRRVVARIPVVNVRNFVDPV